VEVDPQGQHEQGWYPNEKWKIVSNEDRILFRTSRFRDRMQRAKQTMRGLTTATRLRDADTADLATSPRSPTKGSTAQHPTSHVCSSFFFSTTC